MTSRTEKFQRKPAEKKDASLPVEEEEEVIRFSPEEEAVSLLAFANNLFANKLLTMISPTVSTL